MEILNTIPFISFVLLLILVLGRIIFLKRNGIRFNSKSKNTNPKKKVFLYPAFILIMLFFILEILHFAFNSTFSVLPTAITTPFISSTPLKIIGSLLVLFSLIFLFLTLIHFHKSLRFGMNSNNLGRLITTGVFSISRNPFFISLNLYFLGIAFLIPNLFFVAFALSAMLGIHLFISKEEKFMKKNYGEEYQAYASKVRRYF